MRGGLVETKPIAEAISRHKAIARLLNQEGVGPPSIVKPSISSLKMTPPARAARSSTTNDTPRRASS